jgi:predicted transposase YbfD/YdcC
MGTQTQIAQLIQDKGADYCLALKGNHKYLHERAEDVSESSFSRKDCQDWRGKQKIKSCLG